MLCFVMLSAVALMAAMSSAAPSPQSADSWSEGVGGDNSDYPWPWGSPKSWQWPGPNTSAAYWLDQFQEVLDTMQATYWNGTYWPTTIQWEGAVMNTFLAASDRSFLDVLEEYDGYVPGAGTSEISVEDEIHKYFSQVEGYYGNEDTDQIFNAAYDDAQWVVLEWLEAIKFIQEYDTYEHSTYGADVIAKFAHRAHIFYHIVQNEFNTSLCGGGLTWNPALAVYKNAVTNELFLDTSVGMYLYYPGDDNPDPYPSTDYEDIFGTLPPLPPLAKHDPKLLQMAVDEYNWFRSQPFVNSQGLIIDGFHLSPNQTTCDEPNTMVYTYNQGILLSGLRQLWEATGDAAYLTDGYGYIWSVMNATGWFALDSEEAGQWGGLGRYGIMEDYCDAPADCSQNNQIFKGIYFDHMDAFCSPLPTLEPLIPGLTQTASLQLAAEHAGACASYTPWVEHNAHAALSTLTNGSTIIGGWWSADYVNHTQTPAPGWTVQHPGVDEWNQPWLLTQAPWACVNGEHGCNPYGRGNGGINGPQVGASLRRALKMRQNDEQRTVETEASGLGVVRAASDMTSRRAADMK